MLIELKSLKEVGLYIDDPDERIKEKIDVHTINRLLYWGDLKLFDLETDPIVDDYERTEKIRNITLSSTFAKIVKKYPDVVVSIPSGYKNILRKIIEMELRKKYNDDKSNDVIIEQTPEYIVRKNSRTYYSFTITPETKQEMTMEELYQTYLNLPLSTSEINSFINTKNIPYMIFRFTPPNTIYNIGFFFDGNIMSVKVEESKEIKAEDIIEMSRWANNELNDIVDSAKICKEIEETIESDEPETETSYECTTR